MKGKRIAALLLTTTVLFSQLGYAETWTTSITPMPENYEENERLTEEDVTIKEDEALEHANAFLERLSYDAIDEDYRAEIMEEMYKSPCESAWMFDWEVPVPNGSNSYCIYVDTETGQIIDFYQNGQGRWGESSDSDLVTIDVPKISYEKGLEIANTYLKLINPKESEEVELTEQEGKHLSYQYNAKVNGLKNPYKEINIRVDGETGLLESYRISWFEDLVYDNLDGIGTLEDAMEVYENNFEMDYTYIGIQNEDYDLIGTKPAYKPNVNFYRIRAKGLEPVTFERDKNPSQDGEFTFSESQSKAYEKDIISPIESDTAVTKKEIRDQAEAYLSILNEQYSIESCEQRYSHNGTKEWRVRFEEVETGGWSGGSFQFDTFGKMKRYNNYQDEIEFADNGDEQKGFEELKDKATEILSIMFPEELKKANYTIQWQGRLWDHNGKEYPNLEYEFSISPANFEGTYRSGIQIEIGSYSGDISRIENNWLDVELVDESQIIAVDKAKEVYLSHVQASLQYDRVDEESNRVELVYKFSQKINNYVYVNSIDALTGEPLTYSGQVITTTEKDESTEHWAMEAYSLLKDQRIIDEDDKKDLDQLATMRDVIHIMVNAKGKDYYRLSNWGEEVKFTGIAEDDPSYDELSLAIAHNIILNEEREWDWDATVTKEEMIVYIIRASGLEKVSKIPEIYKDVFKDSKDMNPEYKGYIAIAKGLGYISGDTDGNFYPKKEMTYGELVHLVYTLLANNS